MITTSPGSSLPCLASQAEHAGSLGGCSSDDGAADGAADADTDADTDGAADGAADDPRVLPADTVLLPPAVGGPVLGTVRGCEMSSRCPWDPSRCELPLYTSYDRDTPEWWHISSTIS